MGVHLRIKALFLASILAAGGCASITSKLKGEHPKKKDPRRNASLTKDLTWVPLGLTRGAFVAAERRLTKYVVVGMPRSEFLHRMRLTPMYGLEWTERITSGEGWFSQLSRVNKVGRQEIEEFTFGYFVKNRLNERFAVILRNGKVARIVRSPWPEGRILPRLPASLTREGNSLEGETAYVKAFYRKRLQSFSSYRRILPLLKKIRPGWTSAEVRIMLGGSLYRLPNGLIYFQEGLLWGEGLSQNSSGGSTVVTMPFGYRDASGRVHTRAIVRAEGGIVTSVFWQPAEPSRPGRKRIQRRR